MLAIIIITVSIIIIINLVSEYVWKYLIFSDEKRGLKLEIIALDNRNESVRVKLGKQSHSEHLGSKRFLTDIRSYGNVGGASEGKIWSRD